MTRKLLLTIALGAALAVAAAGTASSVGVGSTTIQVQVPAAGNLPQCSDLSDNDGDGLVDLQDPGCIGPLDNNEYTPPAPAPAPSGGGSQGGGTETTPAPSPQGGSPGLFKQQTKKGAPGTPQQVAQAEKKKIQQPGLRNPDGSPTDTNPGLTIAQF